MAPVEKVDEQPAQDDGPSIGLIYPPPEVRSIFLILAF